MAKLKTNPAYIVLLFLPIIITVTAGVAEEEQFLKYLRTRLQTYNSEYNSEKAFVLTDRFVYRAGEDIWFKGFITPVLKTQNNDDDFFIRLVNINGEEIVYRRYPLNDYEASGHIAIPKSCIPGKYWLIAYSGWMKNQSPEEAFRKEILISKYFEKRFQADVTFDRNLYYQGDTLNALIIIRDAAGKPVAETEFDFNLGTLNRSEFKGNGKTDVKGKAKISAVIPETDDLLMLNIEIHSRRVSGDYSRVIPSFTGRPSISFYPEGGTLVKGLKSRVGVSAENRYGIKEQIKAVIVDASGELIDTIETNAKGIGVVEYTPGKDSAYLKLISPIGIQAKYALPEPVVTGMAIRWIHSTKDSALFLIRSNHKHPVTSYWTAVINRKMVWSASLQFSDSAYISIPLEDTEAGIIQVSVFDENHTLAAERIIRTNDSPGPFTVKIDKKVYQSRQRVNVLVEYPKNLIGRDLALSVSLQKLGEAPLEHNSGLNAGNDGDAEMLTSEFRSVRWEEVLFARTRKNPYNRMDGLIGTVYDKKENVSPHAKVRVTHFPSFRMYETQSDENGIFHVSFGSDVIDYKLLNIDAYDATGKINLDTKIDYSYVDRVREIITDENKENESAKVKDLLKYGEPDLVYVLRYGPGKFRKSGSDTHKKYDPFRYSRYTDVLDIIQDIKPYRLTDNKIVFTEPVRNADTLAMEEAILVINGVLKGNKIGALKNIIPSDITNINVSTSLFDVHKYTPLNFRGVIEITTIQGTGRYRQAAFPNSSGLFNTSEKLFYSPDYALESAYSADNRRTLYWNPKILYQGNSMLVTFYTSDIKGTFYGHLSGLDQDGNPVDGEFTFEVE